MIANEVSEENENNISETILLARTNGEISMGHKKQRCGEQDRRNVPCITNPQYQLLYLPILVHPFFIDVYYSSPLLVVSSHAKDGLSTPPHRLPSSLWTMTL